ncbi:hypothetical protein [Maribacter sp. ACAM166]|uniref:hypothetical protein n=1 Tax=Maribacter sp. ACAM166 TaxID=2508996 RepID=UPI0010FE2D12|nr:hypothetical protein [Maribacter sp. ACAM166]TLP73243.1 hypothetical protein ES765_17420 [Maribacter sp. ACAM166]
MKTIVVNFKEPVVINKVVKNGKLKLSLNWYGMGKGTSIISKTSTGYNYEDVGFIKRNFNDIDRMIWEYELPKSLKMEIEKLPITNRR